MTTRSSSPFQSSVFSRRLSDGADPDGTDPDGLGGVAVLVFAACAAPVPDAWFGGSEDDFHA